MLHEVTDLPTYANPTFLIYPFQPFLFLFYLKSLALSILHGALDHIPCSHII